MNIAALVHLPVGMILGLARWVRSTIDLRARERALALREQTIAARTQQLAELDVAERNLANQRWGGLQLELPDIIRAHWHSGRVDLTLSHTIRNRRAVNGFVETVQGSVTWPTGIVTALEAKRVDQLLGGGNAHNFSRPVQWIVPDDQLQWLTGPKNRIALASCTVTLEIFARLDDEVVRLDVTNQSVELLVSG